MRFVPADRRAGLAGGDDGRRPAHAVRPRRGEPSRRPAASAGRRRSLRESPPKSARADSSSLDRGRRSRPAARAHRRCRVVLLGEATHGTSRVLPDARPHHPELDRARGFRHRRGRGRLARRRAGRPLRPPRGPGRRRRRGARLHPLPDLDVAQRRGAATSSSGCASYNAGDRRAGAPGRASTASTSTASTRSIARGARLPRRRRSRGGRASPASATAASRPGQDDPAAYGRAALSGRYRDLREARSVAMLRDLLERRLEYAARDGERFFDAVQNARVVADAERYYRVDVLRRARVLEPARPAHVRHAAGCCSRSTGPRRKAVVWEHNSHVGDAARHRDGRARRAQRRPALPRRRFGDDAYLVGFGTDHGTVAAAHDWDGPMQVMAVRPAHPESYERLCHDGERAGLPAAPARAGARRRCATSSRRRGSSAPSASSTGPRPSSQSHYFQAVAAPPVRRVRLVRRDLGRSPVRSAGAGESRSAGDVPLRAVSSLSSGARARAVLEKSAVRGFRRRSRRRV